MIDIDDLVRSFRADLPAPLLPAPADVAEGVRRPGAARRGRGVPRLLRLGAGGLAAGTLAAVLVFLFVQGNDSRRHATSTVPRADWGLVATMRITPQAGVSDDEAMSAFIEAVERYAVNRDIPGLRADPVAANRVRVTYPAGLTVDDAAAVPILQAFEVFDLSRDLIAEGTSLRDLQAAAAALPGPPVRFFFGQPSPAGVGGFARTREDAEATIRRTIPGGVVLPLPADVMLVDRYPQDEAPQLMLVRDRPLVTARQLDSASLGGGNLSIAAGEEHLEAVHRAADAAGGGESRFAVIAKYGSGQGVEYGVASTIASTDTGLTLERFSTSAENSGTLKLGLFIVPGTAALEAVEPYGAEPAPVGEAGGPLPVALQGNNLTAPDAGFALDRRPGFGAAVAVDPGSIVRAVTVTTPTRTWSLFTALALNGRVVATVDNGPDTGFQFCSAGVGVAAIRTCGSVGAGSDFVMFGRVRDDVTLVTAITPSGDRIEAAVTNGWFLLPYRDSTALSDTPRPPEITVAAINGTTGAVLALGDGLGRFRPPGLTP